MNDWIHCNKCYLKYNSNVKLFLTECGHLMCEGCAENVNNLPDSQCVICRKSTKIVPISKEMDPTVQEYFIPFEMHLKKAIEVCSFQMQHKSRLFQAIMQKYGFAKKECISCHNKNKNLVRENKMLKTMLMSLGQGNHQPFLTSTPILKSDMSPADNMSMSSIGFTPNKHVPTGVIAGKPGFAQRTMAFGNNMLSYLSSGGSSQLRPSPVHMVPIHRTTLSLDQLRRAAKRT